MTYPRRGRGARAWKGVGEHLQYPLHVPGKKTPGGAGTVPPSCVTFLRRRNPNRDVASVCTWDPHPWRLRCAPITLVGAAYGGPTRGPKTRLATNATHE